MSTQATIPMFDPQGNLGDIPMSQARAAMQAGARPAVNVLDPEGNHGYIPADRVQDAVKAGGKVLPYEQQEAQNPGLYTRISNRVEQNFAGSNQELGREVGQAASGSHSISSLLRNTAGAVTGAAQGLWRDYHDPANVIGDVASAYIGGKAFGGPEPARPTPKLAPTPERAAAPQSAVERSGVGVQNAPYTYSGESALRQILTGQDNKALLQIARSRGINVTAESQLRPGLADAKLINKIIDDFSPDELDEVRSKYMETTRMGLPSGLGAEAFKTASLQTYFPDLKLPQARLARTQKAFANRPRATTLLDMLAQPAGQQ